MRAAAAAAAIRTDIRQQFSLILVNNVAASWMTDIFGGTYCMQATKHWNNVRHKNATYYKMRANTISMW